MLSFAIVVVLIVCLVIALIRSIPNIPAPLDWMLQVVVLLVGIVVIAARAGIH